MPGVARMSEQLADVYDATLRPAVKAMVTPELAEMNRASHPMRTTRAALNSGTPGMNLARVAAEKTRQERSPVDPKNPFLVMESIYGQMVENTLDVMRDLRESAIELTFLGLWANPMALAYGHTHAMGRTRKDPNHLADEPQVKLLLQKIDQGGLAEAIIRMLVLIAGTRKDVRHDRLERSMETMHSRPPLSAMQVEERVKLIHEQTVIARFAPQEALATLPKLITTQKDRKAALDAVHYVIGAAEEMVPETRIMLEQMGELLNQKAAPGSTAPAAAE